MAATAGWWWWWWWWWRKRRERVCVERGLPNQQRKE